MSTTVSQTCLPGLRLDLNRRVHGVRTIRWSITYVTIGPDGIATAEGVVARHDTYGPARAEYDKLVRLFEHVADAALIDVRAV